MTCTSTTPVIAIHGGAGTLSRSHISPEQEASYHSALDNILRAATKVIARTLCDLLH